MNKKELIIALCKKNDYTFNEVSMIDITHGEYFQLAFPTPDENKINSMNEVNYLIDFLENLILESEKEVDKKFNSEIFMIEDSKLVFGGWKQKATLSK
jgi:hypothetical protein